ncbi:MAG: amino acid ABC transporter permease [Clostridiales bacterium]|nr:MAG: amino acid ABC transporter permease [Clostridiales bacterium]
MKFFSDVAQCFTNEKYFSALLEGLKLTLAISVGAAIIGLFLGTLVALVRLSSGKSRWMKIPRAVCNVYLVVIRGTPMALQLFIMAFIIFAIRGFPKMVTAILAFGINSGAYVAENIRAGILSVDIGQTEAGRALGLTQGITMRKIIIPQAIKNVIPAIGNELIALIKETSIVSMIGMFDLTAAAQNIGSGHNLASYLGPMTVAALFYLVIVYALTFAIKRIERRLRSGDKR